MSTIYKCDRCGREMNKIHNRLKEVVIEGKSRFEGTKYFEPETLDLCEECYKDFKSFMFGPERDLDSKTTLRPWSEVGEPPKINGYPLAVDKKDTGCEQCEFDSISIDEEPCASCGSGNSNFKLISEDEDCEQCKFKDFSWDEEPCSSCDVSNLANNSVKRTNFEPNSIHGGKDEEDSRYSTDADTLPKAKYKVGSYIRSDMNGDSGNIYKIVGVRLRDDGRIVYTIKNLKTNNNSFLPEIGINTWYTVIVKYSCDGCKLEAVDDCRCDTCSVPDEKGMRRQWWKPKEEY